MDRVFGSSGSQGYKATEEELAEIRKVLNKMEGEKNELNK